jgi:zeaxanthin glucosyltransferase
MKIGFICPTVPGHLNPMTALSRQLQARGHEVVFLYASSAAGLSCIPADENDYVNEGRSEISRLQGEDVLVFSLQQVLRQTEGILNSMPVMVEKSGVDAVILDTVQFYAELAPMRLGIPYIHVALLSVSITRGILLIVSVAIRMKPPPEAFRRNREVVVWFLPMISNDGIKAYASNAGLKIDWDDPASTMSKLAWITQAPKEFDFESSHWPSQFYQTGPFHDGKGRESVDFPWERLTGEPLIYASMGTILNGQPEVFRTIAAGVAKHKDVQLVLSIGDHLEPEQIGPVPRNAIVVKRAISTPLTTAPVLAAGIARLPVPHATSSTRNPGLRSRRAMNSSAAASFNFAIRPKSPAIQVDFIRGLMLSKSGIVILVLPGSFFTQKHGPLTLAALLYEGRA